MWPGSSVSIVINALIFLVHSLPPNIDRNTLRNDPVARNEKILKLFLQLATHTANRLTHLRKKTDKEYDCNKDSYNPRISTTEALIAQSPQKNLEWLDKSQKSLNYSGDSEINSNQNQTAFYSELQELSDVQNINDNQDIERNLNMSNLIPKSIQDVQDTLFDATGHNHEALNFDTLQEPILDSDTANNSLNGNESLISARNDVNEKINQIDLKNITNTSIVNNLTKTVRKFFSDSQNLQEPTLEISQRLFGTDLAQTLPKIISDVHRNVKQHIPLQNTRELSDRIDDVSQRYFHPSIVKNSAKNLNSRAADNLTAVSQISSSTKNIVESMIKVLPEAAKDASNLLNHIIPQFQNIINIPLKVTEEDQKYLTQSNYIQQEHSENVKQEGDQLDDLLHNRQDLTNNSRGNIHETTNASGKNNQETIANDLPINNNNSTAEDNNKQHVPTLLKGSSIPSLRSLTDFNEQKNNNNKTETNLSSMQTNENTNSFTNEEIIRDQKKTEHLLDQIDEEIKVEGFKKTNETQIDFIDRQLNPISEDSSQESKDSGLTDAAVTTSEYPNQLDSITEHSTKSSSGTQDFENVSDVIKYDLEEMKRLEDNSSANDGINRSTENQIIHNVDNLLESNSRSLIDNLKGEDLHVQLSEAKLQEISDRLINVLWPIIENGMDNNQSYATNHYSK